MSTDYFPKLLGGIDDCVADIHTAARSGDLERARELLESGSSQERYINDDLVHAVNSQDSMGQTPLFYACSEGHFKMVEMLVTEFQADAYIRDVLGRTAVMVAAVGGHGKIVMSLLADCGVYKKLLVSDYGNRSVLHYACAGGDIDLVRTLIRYKADISAEDDNNVSPLHVAILHGHMELVIIVIKDELKCDVNTKDSLGRTLLHHACSVGCEWLVRILISEHNANINLVQRLFSVKNVDANAQDNEKSTPLHLACRKGHDSVVKFLVSDCQADVNALDNEKSTPLHLAYVKGHYSIVKFLVSDCHADVNAQDNRNYTPLQVAVLHDRKTVAMFLLDFFEESLLHTACSVGNISMVRDLIYNKKVSVTSRDYQNNTPLHVAALWGQSSILEFLYFILHANLISFPSKGHLGRSVLDCACIGDHANLVRILITQLHYWTSSQKNTALHAAAFFGSVDIACLLIEEFKCDISFRGQDGRSVLHSACIGGNVNLIQTLINRYQADTKAVDAQGNTPLHVAALHGKLDATSLLIKHFECDTDIKGEDGRTPLHSACAGGHEVVVQMLVSEYQADVMAVDVHNNTPLHVAALCGRLEVTNVLINEYNCDIDARGQNNRILLHSACIGGNVSLVQTLINQYQADITAVDDQNNTPLLTAAWHGKIEVVLMLIKVFKCDVSVRGQNGRNLFHIACLKGYDDLVKAIHSPADIQSRDDDMNTPLHIAAYHGNNGLVSILIDDFECDINVGGYQGRSVLHCACSGGHVSLVRTLILQYKADVNALDDQRHTPLQVAVLDGKKDVAETLIEEFVRDTSLLHIACSVGNENMVRNLLLKNASLIYSCDKQENTPLHVAALWGHQNVVSVFMEFECPLHIKGHLGQSLLHSACIGGHYSHIEFYLGRGKAII